MKRNTCLVLLLLLGFMPAVAGTDNLEEINFPLNSSIVVDGFQGLDVLAQALSTHEGLDLEVIGYADSQGSAGYNQGLSQRRAESVKQYLVSHGAKDGQIQLIAKGEDAPYNNKDREGRFQNRSVALTLFETMNGSRQVVTYPRLLELLFGKQSQAAFVAPSSDDSNGHNEIMVKLSDLQKQVDEISQRLKEMAQPQAMGSAAYVNQEKQYASAGVSKHFSGYNGMSLQIGADDNGDLVSQVRGMYLRQYGRHLALQGQGNYHNTKTGTEGQIDGALIYQDGPLKIATAASYKFLNRNNLDSARLAQAAMVMNYNLENASLGFFSTTPLLEGDVVSSTPSTTSSVYVTEQYIDVPAQVGLSFGANLGERTKFYLFGSKLYTQGDTDKSLGANLEFKLFENFNLFVDVTMNGTGIQANDDSVTYAAGMKLGSWTAARYGRGEDITPVDIPSIRYEILSRTTRVGNTAPIAKAGTSLSDVAAGTVTLDGRGSSDPEGDALSYKWTQLSGPNVTLSAPTSAVTSFTGVAGEAYRFQLNVSDKFGASSSDIVSITMVAAPIPDPIIQFLTVSPTTILKGEMASLSWSTVNATSINISNVGDVIAVGSVLVSPAATTTYLLTAKVGSKTTTKSVTLTVTEPPPPPPVPAPTISFLTLTPSTINEGQFTTLNWSTKDAEVVTLEGFGEVDVNGSIVLAPNVTTTYTLKATNASGMVTKSATVTVIPLPPSNTAPIANAGFDQVISPPGVVQLDGSASFDPDAGDTLSYIWIQTSGPPVALIGADTAFPSFMANPGSYTFKLTVFDGHGESNSDSVSVDVINFKN